MSAADAPRPQLDVTDGVRITPCNDEWDGGRRGARSVCDGELVGSGALSRGATMAIVLQQESVEMFRCQNRENKWIGDCVRCATVLLRMRNPGLPHNCSIAVSQQQQHHHRRSLPPTAAAPSAGASRRTRSFMTSAMVLSAAVEFVAACYKTPAASRNSFQQSIHCSHSFAELHCLPLNHASQKISTFRWKILQDGEVPRAGSLAAPCIHCARPDVSKRVFAARIQPAILSFPED